MVLRRIAFLLILLSLVTVPVQAADSGVTIEVTPLFDGRFKVGQWLPVQVTVTNNGADHDAVVRIGGTSGATFDATVELPQGARKTLLMYVRPESFTRSLKARVFAGDEALAEADMAVSAWSAATEIIGLLTAQSPTAPLPVSTSTQIKVAAHPLTLEEIPTRAEGLSSFTAIMVDGIGLERLAPEQHQALEDWMRGGGQLVVAMSDGSRALDVLPENLRIATAGETASRGVADTLLASLGPEATITATTLTPIDGATALDPLAAQKEWGRGRLTILGISLSDPALGRLPADSDMWTSVLRLREFDPNYPPDVAPDEMQAQQLTQALYNLPMLSLPPLGVLVGLLIAYMLLVGPVLYLVLWRLDRQAWAWVAIPVLTLLFSAGAYGYGLRIRGNDIILNQISIVFPAGERARVRTYAGLFSPTARTYDITIDHDALTRPLLFDPRSWGREVGASGSRGQYLQGSSAIRNLPVAQWAMSTFAAEGTVAFGSLEARLELGEGVVKGTVHNRTTLHLRDVALIYGNRGFPVGNLAPGEEKPIEANLNTPSNLGGAPLSMMLFRGRWNPNMAPPPELRLPIQVVDSLYGYNPAIRQTEPFLIGWLNESPLGLHVEDSRLHHQQLTLVEFPATISYADSVTFPRGWLRPQFQSGGPEVGACMTQWGSGAVLMNSETVTATLRLPPAARSLHVNKASVFTNMEGPPADRVSIEVFDSQTATWLAQSNRLGTVELSDPARFIHNHELRVRATFSQGMNRGGCVHISASVGGTR
jgi:hypothetical protein